MVPVTGAARFSSQHPSASAPLLAGLATLGPYFAVETHDPRSRPQEPWQPLSAVLGSAEALNDRITEVRARLAATAGCPPGNVELRVAASVAQLGLVARLISPALGSAVLGVALPMDVTGIWWIPALGGPFPLSLPRTALAGTPRGSVLAEARGSAGTEASHVCGPLLGLLDGPLRSLVETTASMAVSRRVLWGNVASALNGAASMIAAARPDLAARTAAITGLLAGIPALAGSYDGQVISGFRRRSCCLIYRLASRPATGYCGDCILNGGGTLGTGEKGV